MVSRLGSLMPLLAVALAGCPGDKPAVEAEVAAGDAADASDSSATDTAVAADTDDDTAVVPDAPDADTVIVPSFGPWSHGIVPGLDEIADLALGGDELFAVGVGPDGLPSIVAIDRLTGDTTAVYDGDPLVAPTGLALSPDGSTLFVSDVAAETSDDSVSGGVFAIDLGTGQLETLVDGAIDLPGDVAVAAGGTSLFVSGFDPATGHAAIFSVALGTGLATIATSQGLLADPLALAPSHDGHTLYVLDARADHGRPAILSLSLPGFMGAAIATAFTTSFPGGLAVTRDDASVYFTALAPGLLALSPGGSAVLLDGTSTLVEPTAVVTGDHVAFVSDLASAALADLFLLTF